MATDSAAAGAENRPWLAEGGRTIDVAKRFGVSLARISQLRREFERSWLAFHGEEAEREQMEYARMCLAEITCSHQEVMAAFWLSVIGKGSLCGHPDIA